MTNTVNRPMDLSEYSFTEAGYLINEAITESCNDLIVRMMEADRRSLQENGYTYFSEADNDSKGFAYIVRRVKELIKNAIDAVLGLFQKVIDFFRNIGNNLALLGVKTLSATDKEDFALYSKDQKLYDSVLSASVKKCFDIPKIDKDEDTKKTAEEYVEDVQKRLDAAGGDPDKKNKAILSVKDIIDKLTVSDRAKIKEIITPQYVLNNVFGGFKDLGKSVLKERDEIVRQLKELEKAVDHNIKASTPKDRNSFTSADKDTVNKNENYVTAIKMTLKYINNLTTATCKVIVTQSKIIASFAKNLIEKGSSGKSLDKNYNARVKDRAGKYKDEVDSLRGKSKKNGFFNF